MNSGNPLLNRGLSLLILISSIITFDNSLDVFSNDIKF